jgi:hypothetical protein
MNPERPCANVTHDEVDCSHLPECEWCDDCKRAEPDELPAGDDYGQQAPESRVRPDGPETAEGGLIGQQPY